MLEGRRQRFREVLGKLDDAVTAFKAQVSGCARWQPLAARKHITA